MDKRAIVSLVIDHLTAELETVAGASREAREAATHEDNRAEDKYDTRATESSYLADGQARHAVELREAIELYRTLALREFGEGEPIALAALVEVQQRKFRDLYFIGPRNGGVIVRHEGTEVMVITPQSPLGHALLGRRVGDSIRLEGGREATISSVL
ncbi:MAG: GreA/GreB family elongation factor [Opitutaceae bacterium]|nr:GreA/GreB family elongation factor [Opitutaceae bacterium]